MKEIYEIIGQLIKMPGVYGINRVEDIKFMFLGGDLFYPNNVSLCNEFVTAFNIYMNDFFRKEYNFKDFYDWDKLIRLYSGSDKHSLELFSKFFYEYLESIRS